MKTHGIKISVFLAVVVVLCIAGTKISRLTQTTTFQGDSLFLVVTGSQSAGTLATRNIEATNVWRAFTNLYPISAAGGSATNAQPPSTALTNAAAFLSAGLSNRLAVTGPGGYLTNAAKVYYVDTNHAHILSNIVAGLSSGDVAELGAGRFDIGFQSINIPVGATLRGQGQGTIIAGNSALFTNGPLVTIQSSNAIENLDIDLVSSGSWIQAGLGFYYSIGDSAPTNATVRNVRVLNGQSDGVYLQHTNYFSVKLFNCSIQSKWDALVADSAITNGIFDVEVWNTTIISDMSGATLPAAISTGTAKPVRQSGGTLKLYGCSVTATNATTSHCISLTGPGPSKIFVIGGDYRAAGTNEAFLAEGIVSVYRASDHHINVLGVPNMTGSTIKSGSFFVYHPLAVSSLFAHNATIGTNVTIGGTLDVVGLTTLATADINTSLALNYSAANRVPYVNGANLLVESSVTGTELGYLSGVTSAIQTQLSNDVRVAAGTGGITVTPSGSGGIMTYTISDDDAGGGSTTNFTTLAAGSLTVGTVIASNLVRAGQVDILTNLNVQAVQVTNSVTIGTTNVVAALAGKQAASMVLSNITGLASTVFTNVPLGGTNISVRTAGGTNFIDTTGELNNWAQHGTNQLSTNALLAVLNFASNQVRVAAGSGVTVTPAGSGNVMTYTVAATAGSNGGTNYPPVIHAGTNITLGSGVRQFRTISTNASFGINFGGTALNGETVRVGVSNYATSTIYWTNFQASTLANVYVPSIGGLASVFTIGPTSISTFDFVWHTNYQANGSVRQELQWQSGYEYRVVGGALVTLSTNAGVVTFEGKLSATPGITNTGIFKQTGIATFSEVVHVDSERLMASVGIDSATLFVTNTVQVSGTNFAGTIALPNVSTNKLLMTGGGSNVVAASIGQGLNLHGATLATTGNLSNLSATATATNMVGLAFDYGLLYAATNTAAGTNITINFSPHATNHLDIYTTNWWCQWTNISGLAAGNLANKVIRITPSAPGQNLTNIWPVGNQHGIYRWQTNANSTFWTVLTNAKTYVVSMTAYGTNIHATISLWE